MNILIKTVRVYGFRALQNIEVNLNKVTVLTGMNNSGKTSFLKALQTAIGNKQFLTHDDFNINTAKKIVIDLMIIPINEKGQQQDEFDEDWASIFTESKIRITDFKQIVPLRTIVTYNEISKTFKTEKFILKDWPVFENWFESEKPKDNHKISFSLEEINFYYIDAQRDILEDIRTKTSYLGRLISKIDYKNADELEKKIQSLNEETINNSETLTLIKETLKGLNFVMDSAKEGIDITPFTKKIRDLNKSITISYTDDSDSFSMEYHGMGTRSWSSLLTLKSFIKFISKNYEAENKVSFHLLALEEPESHLHPNAQKKLYSQLVEIEGQKIISTHSPYIMASTELDEIRLFYKSNKNVICGNIDVSKLDKEQQRRIKREVINTRGEIFFSKAVVLFEGETEEQALPIFFEYFFKKPFSEMGINFIGVGGFGKYSAFLQIAQSLNIPWFIFSDGEKDTLKELLKPLKIILNNQNLKLSDINNVVILDNNCNFEKYLIQEGYQDEIVESLENLNGKDYVAKEIHKKYNTSRGREKTDNKCPTCNQNIYKDILRNYSGEEGFKEALLDCMTFQKTKFGPEIANVIVNKEKKLPQKVIELFEKITKLFS